MTPPSSPAIVSLLAITEKLTALLNTENDLLTTRRPSSLNDLIAEKKALTKAYDAEMKSLLAAGGIAQITDASLLRTLKKETQKFHGAMKKQHSLLKAAKVVSERMIKAIGIEAARQAQPVRNYGPKAQLQGDGYGSSPTPITLNQTI